MAAFLTDRPGPAAGLAGKCLTFRLGSGRYGMSVLRVRKIIGPTALTPTPGMRADMLGVINLRGRIIPVADLRERFGMEPAPSPDLARIIMVKFGGGPQPPLVMGRRLDAMDDVLNVTADEVQEPPRFGVACTTEHLLGMAKSTGLVTTLLNLDRLPGGDDLTAIRATQSSG
jgi:purine-binding chemotaxis protein CheW